METTTCLLLLASLSLSISLRASRHPYLEGRRLGDLFISYFVHRRCQVSDVPHDCYSIQKRLTSLVLYGLGGIPFILGGRYTYYVYTTSNVALGYLVLAGIGRRLWMS